MSNRIKYDIPTQQELNLSYMPFIIDGGLFIPTSDSFLLGENIIVDLQLPGQQESTEVEAKVVWITPKNAIYQIFQGVGVQLTGTKAKSIHEQIKMHLDNTIEVGGYTDGFAKSENA